jgi:hypothetical protein
MEFFDDEVIDFRLFTPEYFQNKYKGLPDETYEFMAQRANVKYYKYDMLQELRVVIQSKLPTKV